MISEISKTPTLSATLAANPPTDRLLSAKNN